MPAKPPAKTSAKPAGRRRRPLLKALLVLLALGLLGGGGFLAWLWSSYSREADSFLTLFALRVPKTITKVLDRNGDVVGVFAEEHRVVIPYGDIPKAFVGALVATEDADFWSHDGVSPRGILRAGITWVATLGRRKEGASTLTMQLVRTVTAKRQKQLNRKLKEIVLARKLEKAYKKKQIFEAYANEVYFGGGRYGIEAAAQYYFGKSAPQLNVEECALLAGLVQNPSWYHPYNPDPKVRAAVKARRNHVLRRMVAEGYLKESDAKVFMERPIRLARENAVEEAVAPYAVEEVRKYLYEKYGKDAVLNGGLEVYTTLDSAWQVAANEAVRNGLRAVDRRRGFRKDAVQTVEDPDKVQLPGWKRFLEDGDQVRGVVLGWTNPGAKDASAEVRFGATTLKVPASAFAWAGKDVAKLLPRGAAPLFLVKDADDEGRPAQVELDQEPEVEAALLAMDPKTGEVRAMVGGYSYARSKFNRAWQAERHIGSTVKAFVYGTAFEQGMTPATLVNDVPTRFIDPTQFDVIDGPEGRVDVRPSKPGAKEYAPQNYERDFWGPIPIWEALRDSRNLPAVRTLDEVGIGHVRDFAAKLGVTGTIPPYPSLALGAADLSLKEMVRAYATLANYGKQAPAPFLIRKVVDRNGRVLEVHEGNPGEEVVDPKVAFELIQCFQGVATQGTGARTNDLNWPVAGKTGTTDEHTDAWFIGFSTRIACGVWVGLDEKKTIYRGADGGKVAVPIWTEFMKTAVQGTPREDFKAPEGMEWAQVDRYTGLLASGATTDKVLSLAFPPGLKPKAESTAEAIARIREARDKARHMAAEVRVLGRGRPRTETEPLAEPPKAAEAPKAEPRAEARPDAKVEAKAEPRPDARTEPKADPKADAKKAGPQKSW